MKKFYTLCLIMALSLGAYAQTKKIAVYFMGEGDEIVIASNKLSNALAQNGQFVVSDRTASFSAALGKEQSYQRSGSVDENEIFRLGKQYGVQYVCVAAIIDIFGEKYFTARILNVEKAQVVSSANAHDVISSLDKLTSVMKTLSNRLLQSLKNSESSSAKKIAVYVTQTGNKDVDIVLGDQLVSGFAKSNKYAAIERTNGFLKQLSKEQNFQRSGAVDDSQISQIGVQFGVQYVCVSETRKAYGSYNIYARIIDVEKNEIVNSCDVDAHSLSGLNDVVKVAEDVATRLSGMTISEQKKMEQEKAIAEQQEKLNKQVTDCEGRVYPVVKIGNQYWMAENLSCTKYDSQSERAGVRLYGNREKSYAPYYTDGKYTNTDYSGSMASFRRSKLGFLYNWAAAMGYDDFSAKYSEGRYNGRRQGICPNGWHIPSKVDWDILESYCGGESVAGSRLKASGGWYKGGNGSDLYNFYALPAGYASGNKVYDVGRFVSFWTADATYQDENAYSRYIYYNENRMGEDESSKGNARSVRCVRD